MVSTEDGHEIFSCTDRRYDVTLSPVIDPIDIVIQSALSLLTFRDITLSRAEYEVGRETVVRLPGIWTVRDRRHPPDHRAHTASDRAAELLTPLSLLSK
jgi:hypothetical protein